MCVWLQSLYRLDVVGRFLSRAYFTPWTWDCNSDMCVCPFPALFVLFQASFPSRATTYHMNHSLSLLADEDTSIVVKGAAFLHNFLGWILSQQYFKKLEPTW